MVVDNKAGHHEADMPGSDSGTSYTNYTNSTEEGIEDLAVRLRTGVSADRPAYE